MEDVCADTCDWRSVLVCSWVLIVLEFAEPESDQAQGAGESWVFGWALCVLIAYSC